MYYGKGELYHLGCDPGPSEESRYSIRKRSVSEETAIIQALEKLKDSPEGILGLLPNPPLELAEAAYRVQAKANHPDHGGTTGRMKRINMAIDALRNTAK